jgi:hypothetical protein
MEKNKIAIFVEGQAELIVVRELLLKAFDYQNIEVECRYMLEDWNIKRAEYDYTTPNPKYHFHILNVANDERVLGAILEQETHLYNNDYSKIIGLRDMYGKKYREKSKQIDKALNQKFIDNTQKAINEFAKNTEKISFHYAIMEVETWFLALPELLIEIDPKLTPNYIFEQLGFDLTALDPETEFFHPAKTLHDIFTLIGKGYDKKSSTINDLASHYSKDDYELLALSEKCNSFKVFYHNLIR